MDKVQAFVSEQLKSEVPAFGIGDGVKVYIRIVEGEKTRTQLFEGTVIAKNNSDDNKYIQSAELNGKPFNKTYFSHEDIMNGGTLVLVMGNRPNKQWAVGEGAIPPSEGTDIKLMN